MPMDDDVWKRQVDLPGGLTLHVCNFAPSITQVLRAAKRQEHSLFNCIASIVHDWYFISEIAADLLHFPLIANLRCGLWYLPSPAATAYFKSTDGHTGHWSFSTVRLNLHVASLALQHGGVCIVDATRRGKTFPDALTKTVPIWAAVVNRAVHALRKDMEHHPLLWEEGCEDLDVHLAPWISASETHEVRRRLDAWTQEFLSLGTDLTALVNGLRKPFRCVWVSQTASQTEEVDELAQKLANDDVAFIPLVLISASLPEARTRRRLIIDNSFESVDAAHGKNPHHHCGDARRANNVHVEMFECSGNECDDESDDNGGDAVKLRNEKVAVLDVMYEYVPGAGDDEESWARGLKPELMWQHHRQILDAGPDGISSVVERLSKEAKSQRHSRKIAWEGVSASASDRRDRTMTWPPKWLGVPKVALSTLETVDAACTHAGEGSMWNAVGAVLNLGAVAPAACVGEQSAGVKQHSQAMALPGTNGGRLVSLSDSSAAATTRYLWLPHASDRSDKYAVLRHLPAAVAFASHRLARGKNLLIIAENSAIDIAASVLLAIMLACFRLVERGNTGNNTEATLPNSELEWIGPCQWYEEEDCSGARESRSCTSDPAHPASSLVLKPAGIANASAFSRTTVRRYLAALAATYPEIVIGKALLRQVFNAFLPHRMTPTIS